MKAFFSAAIALLLIGCSSPTDFDPTVYEQTRRTNAVIDPEQHMFNAAWIFGLQEAQKEMQ